MAIRVTCSKCHKRFNVSDKFAGKEGPCPSCKTTIRIPTKDDEIKIAVPDDAPKDQQGRSLIKPIHRKETKLSSVQITLIAVGIVGFLMISLVLRMMTGGDTSQFPFWITWIAALAIAPPLVYGAYSLLRDQELGTFLGPELWKRVLICSAVYAALWFSMYLGYIAFNDQWGMGAWMTAVIPMLALGAWCGMLSLDLDYLTGLVHYGLYMGICLIGRLLAGIGFLPGMNDVPLIPGGGGGEQSAPAVPAAAELFRQAESLFATFANWL